jgi:hypothetical protein
MPHFTIRLIGPTATGSRISGPLLRDLLAMVSEGSRRALRMRVEGRSTAAGRIPDRLEPATEFDFLGLSEGSCVVSLEAPTLAQPASQTLGQGNFFLDNAQTSIGLWSESLTDGLAGKADSDRFDGSMLAEFNKSLCRVFAHAVDSFEIRNGKDAVPPLVVRREGIDKINQLRKQTPPPRRIRIAGKLDALEHSDHRLTLILAGGAKVPCWVGHIEEDRLRALWGKDVAISGIAVFRPSGKVLRVEVDAITPANVSDLEIWSFEPEPFEADVDLKALRKPQGPRTGASAVFGQWPGDESDEQIAAYLEEIS